MSKRIKITDFAQDDRNFNRHMPESMELLRKSTETVGVIESFTVSSDDKIISGNARQEKISEVLDNAEPIVVETDGSRPVVLKRTRAKGNQRRVFELDKRLSLTLPQINFVAHETNNNDVYRSFRKTFEKKKR